MTLETQAKELADNLLFGCTPDQYPDDMTVWKAFYAMTLAALTEARSAALKEAMDRIATLEPVHTGGNYAYAAGFRSGLDAAEIELGRMAGGAEDTSTDKEGDGGN